MNAWQRWLRDPQAVFVRRALFQVHLWTGLAAGVYIAVISLSGSILVYRNELYQAFAPRPVIVRDAGAALPLAEVEQAAARAYPDYEVSAVDGGAAPGQAVDVTLRRGGTAMRRLFHPSTAEDLGYSLPAGYRFTAWLLDLHDNLLYGPGGRRVNGAGAVVLLALSASGLILWWPGAARWRGSLIIDRRANWKRFNWTVHSALGFWFLAFMMMWGVTGAYLAWPDRFAAWMDYLEPLDETNPVERVVDRVQYWLAYAHFGRLGGRGIPGCGRGLCDSLTKATWAAAGLVPVLMFVTGVVMWWNRVAAPALRRRRGAPRGAATG